MLDCWLSARCCPCTYDLFRQELAGVVALESLSTENCDRKIFCLILSSLYYVRSAEEKGESRFVGTTETGNTVALLSLGYSDSLCGNIRYKSECPCLSVFVRRNDKRGEPCSKLKIKKLSKNLHHFLSRSPLISLLASGSIRFPSFLLLGFLLFSSSSFVDRRCVDFLLYFVCASSIRIGIKSNTKDITK